MMFASNCPEQKPSFYDLSLRVCNQYQVFGVLHVHPNDARSLIKTAKINEYYLPIYLGHPSVLFTIRLYRL